MNLNSNIKQICKTFWDKNQQTGLTLDDFPSICTRTRTSDLLLASVCCLNALTQQHIWMLPEKRHCDTYWLMLGWRQYWFPSQRPRDRGTQRGGGEREGILTHRPHYCLDTAGWVKFLLRHKDFKHQQNWPVRNFICFQNEAHLHGWQILFESAV